jgi:hypothetical protein
MEDSLLVKNPKCILLLQNHQGVAKYDMERNKRPEAVKEYVMILDELVNYAKLKSNDPIRPQRVHILSKIKGNGGDLAKIMSDKNNKWGKRMETLHNDPAVTLLFWTQEIPMYNFLFSDVVVVEACGTSLPESYIVNPRTIQCQILAHNDFYDIDRYPKLSQANNLNELTTELDRLLNTTDDKLLTPEFEKQREAFIAQFYGTILNPNTNKDIIDRIVDENRR